MSDGGAPPAKADLRRKRRMLLTVVAIALVSTVIGIVAGTTVRSPQQAIADAAPPPRTVLTAPVERRVLSEALVLRGEVVRDRLMPFTPGAPSFAARPIVTQSHLRVGAQIRNGDMVLEIAGRPTFALEGDLPMYRDITPGASGPDVSQLQRALRATGATITDRDGEYRSSTQAALRSLYEAKGYAPMTMVESDSPEAPTEGPSPSPRPARQVPLASMAELVFIPRLPARVAKAAARVGHDLPEPAAQLTAERPKVVAHVNPADAEQVRPGMRVTVSTSGGKPLTAGVVATLRQKTTDQIDGLVVPVVVQLDRTLRSAQVGSQVQVAITSEGPSTEQLVVPVSAVFTSADGQSAVRVVDGDRTKNVPVDITSDANGYVAVTPLAPHTLGVGDEVVVGHA